MKYIILLLYFLILNSSKLTIAAAEEAKEDSSPASGAGARSPVPYKSLMYTRLVFTSESGERIEFPSHELIYIARKVLEETGDHIPPSIVPPYSSYRNQVEEEYTQFIRILTLQAATSYGVSQSSLVGLLNIFYKYGPGVMTMNSSKSIMDNIKSQKDRMGPLVEEGYDSHILPVQIVPEYSALGWLGFARHVNTTRHVNTSRPPISGWWIPIGDRLILLRNYFKERKHFYVSDHGFRDDVVLDTKQNLLNFSGGDSGGQMQYPFEFYRFYKKLSGDEKELLRSHFMVMFYRREVREPFQREFLLYVLSLPKSLREEALENGMLDPRFRSIGTRDTEGDPFVFPLGDDEVKVLDSISAERLSVYEDIFENTLERIRHRGGIQATVFIRGLFEGGLSPFFTQIDSIFHGDDAERFKVFFILKELAKKLGEGLQKYLFRPLYSFGSGEEGESYRGFSEAVRTYYETESPLLPYELAQEIRRLLRGERLSDKKLYFLPNLVAAWFVSESARNELSLLSGLMLLDLIESGVTHIDGDGNNLYDWHHTLVHPRKPADSREEVIIPDLYGDDIDLANFDGIHPMAHGGSVREGRRILGKSQKLSAVQQKEGHLVIHWLLERMKRQEEELGFKIEVSEKPLVFERDTHPDYKEIEVLWKAYKEGNPSQKIKKSPLLNSKFSLLQNIIGFFNERVRSLDNLLPAGIPEIIEADVQAEKKPFFIDPRAAVSEGLMELYATAAEDDGGEVFSTGETLPVRFRHIPVPKNNNCGFNVFGITRKNATRRLLDRSGDAYIRSLVAPEILASIREGNTPPSISSMRLFKVLVGSGETLQTQIDDVARNFIERTGLKGDVDSLLAAEVEGAFVEEQLKLRRLSDALFHAEENLRNFVSREDIYKKFIQDYVGVYPNWLTYNRVTTSSMDALAEILNKNIVIIRPNPTTRRNEQVHTYTAREGEEVLYFFNVDGGTHFNRLELVE